MKIIESGCPDGWCKIDLGGDRILKNTEGKHAVIKLKDAHQRCCCGDYNTVPLALCYKPAAARKKEKRNNG